MSHYLLLTPAPNSAGKFILFCVESKKSTKLSIHYARSLTRACFTINPGDTVELRIPSELRAMYPGPRQLVFPFGKYKEKSVKEVLDQDPSYLTWFFETIDPRYYGKWQASTLDL